MTRYALYYTLNQKIPDGALNPRQRKKIYDKVPNLDDSQRKAFFLLMCEHYLNSEEPNEITETFLPYELKQLDSGVQINFSKIPHELQWVLYKFVEIVSH